MEFTREMFDDIEIPDEKQELYESGSIYKLYLLRFGKFTKIGITQNLYMRFSNIKTMNPYPFKAKKIIKLSNRREALKTEREIHSLLSQYNKRGEWFGLPQKHREKIQRTIPVDIPDEFFTSKIKITSNDFDPDPVFGDIDVNTIPLNQAEKTVLEKAVDNLPQ